MNFQQAFFDELEKVAGYYENVVGFDDVSDINKVRHIYNWDDMSPKAAKRREKAQAHFKNIASQKKATDFGYLSKYQQYLPNVDRRPNIYTDRSYEKPFYTREELSRLYEGKHIKNSLKDKVRRFFVWEYPESIDEDDDKELIRRALASNHKYFTSTEQG
jgi:hypothetical protein